MNRHCHRLVFNPLRNLLMPVAECATAWQGQHHLRARTSQPRTCWAWQPLALAILLLGLPAVALAQILADPAAPAGQRPTILNTASGAVQINIQTPTAGGVSMNQYRQFDTTTPVTIFNNGRSASQTQSAGWVAGNPWLAGGSARVIVNQINSANPSRLSGTMEIAGARADLIIANPSGLRIDGVTVLNANRSTFAAATPQLAGGVVQGFQTGNGMLQINGAGLNDSGSDYTTILARAVQLNAGLWAQQLQLTTGQNQLDASGKVVATTPPAPGSATPAYSLDVAAVGGMYAGKITLLATEHGLGARNAGELVASQGDLQLHLDGRLENTGRMLAQQGGSMQLQSQGLDNDGTLSASHNLHIATGPLTNSGLINAGRELLLDASDISNTASGNISGQRLQIDAASLDNAGQLSQTGQQGLTVQANALHSSGVVGLPPKAGTAPELPSTPDDGAITPPATDSTSAPGGDAPVYSQPVPAQTLPDGTLHVAGLLDNSGSLLANGGIDLSLQQGLQNHGSMQLRTLQLFGPLLDNRQGQLYVDQALIDTGAIHNQDGTLVAGKDMTLRTATLDNGLGNIAAGGELRLLAGQLDNRAGWLEAAGLLFNGGDIDNRQGGIFARDISANSGMVNNTGGLLAASQSLLLDTGGQALWNGDSGDARGVLSGGKLALNSGDLFNLQDGRIQASTLDINSSTLRNQGGLIMGDTLTLSSNTLDNQAGLIAAKSSLTLAAAQSLRNQGELLSLGDAALHADTLQQQGGQTSANGNLAIQARQLASTGQFVAGQDLTLNSQQDLTVQAAIQAGRNLALSTAGKLDNQSGLRAGGSASIQADSISNASQADISASTLNLQATTSLDNQGLIDAGDASIQAGETISNRGSGRIYADRLLLAAPLLDNTPLAGQAAVIAARQQLGIAADQLRNGENAQLISLGDMVIGGGFDSSGQISRPSSLVDNQSASIDAAGNMQISADTVRNQRLRVGITQQSSMDETVTMNLPGWQGNGHNGGDLRASANYRATQIYIVDPADIISNDQIITPDGKVLGRAVVKLSPHTSTFFFANGRGWGMTGERWRIAIDQPQTQTIYYTYRQDSVINPDQSPDGLDPFLLLHGPGGTGGAPYFSYQTDAVRYDAQYGSCSSNCVLLFTPYQLTDPIHTVVNRTGLGTTEPFNELRRTAHHTAQDDVLTADTGAAPTIRAGGNMLLQPGQLLDNQYGQISAADQLQIDGGTGSQIINTAATLYRNHQFDVQIQMYSGGRFAYPQADIRETIGSVDASIQGKTSLIINADTVANLDRGRPGPSPIAPPVPGSEVARLSQTSNGTVQLEPGSNGIPGSVLTQPPTIQLPRSSLYRIQPDGPAPLLETDPSLTNRQAWLGSDYLLAGLSPDPNTSLKRLGDGYYEQQLINQQISRLTGQSLLAGYNDGQAQFRALMDNGKTFAASHQLVPGVALTAAQMAQLTSDIVWLVSQTVTLPDGRSQQVLVPQVYVKLQQGDLAPSGAILAADRLQLQLNGDLTNQGRVAGRQLLTINADTIHNLAGRLQGSTVAAHANTDLNNQGGRIQADHSLSLSAGRDLTSASTTYSQQHGSGGNTLQQTALDRMAGLYLGQGTGPMLLAAGRNLDLSGSQLISQYSGSTVLQAGQDLTLGTVDTAQQHRITFNQNNWSAQGSTDQTGSRLNTQGDLTLQAGGNLAATAATLDSAQGQVQLQAGQDLTLASGQQTQQLEWQSHSSKKGLLSSRSSDDSYQGAQSWAKGSSVSGHTVSAIAGGDLSLIGSQVVSDQGTILQAGGSLSLQAASNTDRYASQHSEQKSGLMGSGGFGITIGSRAQGQDDSTRTTQAVGSTVGALSGNVTLSAGQHYTQTGSNVLATGVNGGGDITIQAKDIAITEARETTHNFSDSWFKQSGLTLALSSPVLNAIQTADQMAKAASKTSDSRMKALAAASSGLSGYAAYTAIQDGQGSTINGKDNQILTREIGPDGKPKTRDANAADKAGGINLSLSVGSSSNKSHRESSSDTSAASRVQAAGNLSLHASGAGQDSNILIQGSDLTATKAISLNADNRIQLQASQDSDQQHSSNSGRSGSIGISFGTDGMLFSASASKNRGHADGDSTRYHNSHLNAGDNISLSSGGDTTLKGAVVAAPSVQAKVGGHLTIESLQDQDHYDSKQNSLGGSLSIGYGMMGGSLSMSQSKINSDYLSVGEQSGILAGDGGFHVKVAGDTTLTGGVISSTETAVQQQNNQFETGGQLAMTDLHNQADYNASSTSLNIGTSMNQQGMWSPSGSGVGFGNDSGSAASDTRSGISGIAGNSAARTGDPQSGIQRIFDADKVQQDIDAQTLITQTFGQQASSAVGKYAETKIKQANALIEQAKQAHVDGQEQQAQQLLAQAEQINQDWGEQGKLRIGLHTVIGGLTGGAAGAAGSLTGSLTAVEASRLLKENGITQENNPALYNTLVTLASSAAGGVVGGSTGAGAAFNEVTNNYLTPNSNLPKMRKRPPAKASQAA
ncbi:hemagglutinin repeat-containing protein [Aquitalea sp. ASV11]|uniref:hemagglutinin repeat-containing protein n=1 Tax=Aquitalea sp. ASV11 TaxID=2795103 RepID=UPI0018ED1D57|nr:hemagglutinin repeat-containing protein [Aquitalea sp. ASV11]